MSSNVGKKNIAHKGSGHGAVAPGAISLVAPPPPPVPTPFPYTARAANASDTKAKLKVGGNEVLVEGSTMSLDPPANQPAQTGGGDVVTHATKNIAVMTQGSSSLTVDGKGVCATGDMAAMNVMTAQSKVAQMTVPILEAADFEAARKAALEAAASAKKKKRAFPPSKANQCPAGHPVDLGTGYVIDDAVDLSLPGFIPLVWSRWYTSARHKERGALGKGGWCHSFEQWLEPTDTGIRLHNEEGLPADFGPIDEDGFSFHRGQRLELRKRVNGYEVRSLDDRLIRTFQELPGGRLALRSVRDSHDHRIQLEYELDTLVNIVDSVGRELRVKNDKNGHVTRVEVWASVPGSNRPPSLQTWFDYAYHVEGELASHTNALGYAERWKYDGFHRMTKVTLRNGVSFYYEYHPELGHCVHTWGDGGLHELYIDIDFEKGETRTHGTNRARRHLWKNGIVWREETFDGEWAVERHYDDDELLIAIKNGVGDGTTYAYDARANLIEETDAAGNSRRWRYRDDLLAGATGPTGLESTYTHDEHGTLSGFTLPTGVSFALDTDVRGQIIAIHGPEGEAHRLRYDVRGNLTENTSSRGAISRYGYDALGRPVGRTDGLGRAISVEYDRMGRVLAIARPDGTRVERSYDPLGNIASSTDALGLTTRFDHAGTGVLARVIRPNGQVYRFLYDEDERLVKIVNPRMETYEFEHDRADQILVERTFDGRRLAYRRNRAGQVIRIDYPEEEWREFQYDKLGHMIEDRGEDVQITFERDSVGRVQKAICRDVTGKVTTEFERDTFGRVIADIQNGRVVRYEHDVLGRVKARVLPDGERTTYEYDAVGALSAMAHGGMRVAIVRDALGRERRRGTESWRLESEYDAMDRLVRQGVVAREPGEGVPCIVAERKYGYDTKGRLGSVESLYGGHTVYRYDRIDQLIEARAGERLEVFEYDPTGSLVSALDRLDPKSGIWSFEKGNCLIATQDARYINDKRGRRIQRVRVGSRDSKEDKTTYGWDTKDRLREVVQADGRRVRFTYDAFGRRVRKDVIGPSLPLETLATDPAAYATGPTRSSVEFLWDGNVLCEERKLCGGGDPSAIEASARKRVFVHERGTLVPALQAQDGQVFAYVNDHLGTPKELIDIEGKVAWAVAHTAWGIVTKTWSGGVGVGAGGKERSPVNTREQPKLRVDSPFRLLGQYADEETGLCYTRFRYFDAQNGRWMSPDPLGIQGGCNLFAFNGSPTDDVDPFGLACKVSVDANVLIAALFEGRSDQVDAALAGRQPVISPKAYQEIVSPTQRPGLKIPPGAPRPRKVSFTPHEEGQRRMALENWMEQRGAVLGRDATPGQIANLQQKAEALGRVIRPQDAAVLGSAIGEGTPLLTNDQQVLGFGRDQGILVQEF
jgi:RHS repeat-associated protein